jgi:hypothetical protein
MLMSAFGFFVLAALLGIYLLSFILTNKNTPKGVAITHGILASIAMILLILYPFFYSPAPLTSIILFLFALVGGLTLIYRDLTGKTLPKWLALGHGITAVIGLLMLILFMIR